MEAVSNLLKLFKKHILKFIALILLTFLFIIVLFPYEDLTDLVSKQIATATNNRLYLKFNELDINLIPVGIDLGDVEIITPSLPSLKASAISVSPSIAKLLAAKYGASVKATGLFGGDIFAKGTMGTENDKKEVVHNIDVLEMDNIKINELQKLFPKVNFNIESRVNAELSEIQIEQEFKTQPAAEFNVEAGKTHIKSITLFNDLTLQDLKFSKVSLRGRLIDGELNLEDVQLGSGDDPLQFQIRGKLALTFRKFGVIVSPRASKYDIYLKLTKKQKLTGEYDYIFRNVLTTPFLDVTKFPISTGKKGFNQYSMKLSGTIGRPDLRINKANF